jgi:DNA-binding NarL/FixJ family response regulator
MADWIGLVEAAYALEHDLSGWTGRVLEAASPLLDLGDGLVACHFARSGAAYALEGVASRGLAGLSDRGVSRILGGTSVDAALLFRAGVDFASLSEAMTGREALAEGVVRAASRGRFADGWGGIAHTGDGRALVLGTGLRERRRPAEATRQRWSRAASHLGAGLRLMHALASGAGADEAVLDPSGCLQHALPAAQSACARESLRRAVRSRDRARTRAGRADEDVALDSWEALISGRWSLVDRFDADGKRFVVARKNDPRVGDPRGLSRCEAQVAEFLALGYSEKQISYALGLSAAAVSRAACQAVRKLGLRSRAELAALFAGRAAPAERLSLELGGERLEVCACRVTRPAALASLSSAEREIASLVSRGSSDAEIARTRGASRRTIGNQLVAIYRKLGIHSRTELAALCA